MRKVWNPDENAQADHFPGWMLEKSPDTRHLRTQEVTLPDGKKALSLQVSGFLAGTIAHLGSRFLAGQTTFPLQEWAELARNADVPTIDRTPNVYSNYKEDSFEEAFDRLLSVANFENEGLTMFLEVEFEDSDRTDPINHGKFRPDDETKAKPLDRFNQLVHDTAAAMHAAGTLGDQEPVMYADIPFHRATKEVDPSAGAYVRCVLAPGFLSFFKMLEMSLKTDRVCTTWSERDIPRRGRGWRRGTNHGPTPRQLLSCGFSFKMWRDCLHGTVYWCTALCHKPLSRTWYITPSQ